MTKTLREQLVGTWKLVSYVERPVDGSEPTYPMGEKLEGIIIYAPDGYMSVQLMRPDRAKFASGDWFGGTDKEIKEARGAISPIPGRSIPTRRRRPHALDVRIAGPELAGSETDAGG